MRFLDVSSYQGSCDFHRVKQALPDLKGVWVKATQGTSYVNPSLKQQVLSARAVGLRVGFYHYAEPDSTLDAAAEARYFATQVLRFQTRGDLRPVLDMEFWSPHLTAAQHVQWARQWNAVVKTKLGAGPLFYSYPAYIEKLKPSTPIGYGLWLASYGRNDGLEHPFMVPAPWKNVMAHQGTSRARVPGIEGFVDETWAKRLGPLLSHCVLGRL